MGMQFDTWVVIRVTGYDCLRIDTTFALICLILIAARGAHRSRHRVIIQHALQVLVGRLIYLLLGDDGPRGHLVQDCLAFTRSHGYKVYL